METASLRFMEATLDCRSELVVPDDGFDPVLELRRLRHDLMLRLQQLQQLIAEKEIHPVDAVPWSTCRGVHDELRLANGSVPPENGTTLYVTPIYRKSDDAPVALSPSGVSDLVSPTPSVLDQTPVVETTMNSVTSVRTEALSMEETVAAESVVDNPVAIVGDSSEEAPVSLFTRILAWLNTILIAIGIVGVVVGIYYHVLRKQLPHPQQLAVTLFCTGFAMVFIGIVGWWLHRQTRLQFCPGS